MTKFEQKVLCLTKKIPRGKVTTYKILAKELGNKKSARAVGNALNKNPLLVEIPCHRVIRNDGRVGKYKEGIEKKIRLLQNEGIKVSKKRSVNLKDYLYKFNQN